MRLLLCLFVSCLFHTIFFSFSPSVTKTPNLAISLEPKTIDLKIRTRVKKKEKIQEVKASPKPTAAPVKKITKKSVEKKKKPIKKKVKKKEIKKKKIEKKIPPKPTPIIEPDFNQKPLIKEQNSVREVKKESNSRKQSYTNFTPRLIERAEYLNNPPPKYPDQARRRKHEGVVTLLVEIDSRGKVTSLNINKSSGHSSLDRAAKKAVKRWRFTPALAGSKQVSSRVIVPVEFQLK